MADIPYILYYIMDRGNSESNDAKSHGVTMQKNEVARASSKYILYYLALACCRFTMKVHKIGLKNFMREKHFNLQL